MAIFRGYDFPGKEPRRGGYVHLAGDNERDYSEDLKKLCEDGAGPKPAAPTACPRGHSSTFVVRLSYKEGFAGAYVAIVSRV